MVVTFPQLGNTYFAGKALFDGLGIDYCVPPLSNKEALEIGCKYSPEEICLPFKIMLGNYILSMRKGADTVVITGSYGPCRYGEYCELQINILKKLSKDINFIVIDNPSSIGIDEFLRRIALITSKSSLGPKEQIKAAINAKRVINLIDAIEGELRYKSGFEVNKGECRKMLSDCKSEAIGALNSIEMLNVLKKYKNKISSIKMDYNNIPLKIAIMGEIYTGLEPFVNMEIEDKLMKYGVSTRKTLTPSWWVKDMALSYFKLNSPNIRMASKKYLPYYIGGHCRECIGEAVLSKRNGFDGAIQIFPMGCMPEIVAKAILPRISRENDFPIMTLIVDEMTGEGGFDTRLEAFIDLLERRKKHVLFGS